MNSDTVPKILEVHLAKEAFDEARKAGVSETDCVIIRDLAEHTLQDVVDRCLRSVQLLPKGQDMMLFSLLATGLEDVGHELKRSIVKLVLTDFAERFGLEIDEGGEDEGGDDEGDDHHP